MDTVLVIPDLHAPGHLEHFIDFMDDVSYRFKPTKIVCLGDLIDFHYISRHPTEPSAMNPLQELEAAKAELKRWVSLFPEVSVCFGNHDDIPVRQAATLGMPREMIVPLNELLGLPDTWQWANAWEIDNVVYEHGIGSTGMYGCKRTANAYRRSYVQGHTHSNAGVFYLDGPMDTIFGMNAGCGMDYYKYFAKYGRSIFKTKPSIGCGVVIDGREAHYIPMDLKKYGEKEIRL